MAAPLRAPLALAAVLALVALAACGDDPDQGSQPGGSPNEPTGTTAPGTGGGIPDLPRNEDPAAVQCTAAPKGVFDATAVVGEPLAEAERAARAEGCSVREVERDGRPLAATDDFRPSRVNVATEDRVVIRIVSLG